MCQPASSLLVSNIFRVHWSGFKWTTAMSCHFTRRPSANDQMRGAKNEKPQPKLKTKNPTKRAPAKGGN